MIKESAHRLALLDTHIWIWLVTDNPRVQSSPFIKKIKEFEAQHGLRVSVISIWEIGMLHAKGRLELPFSPHEWIQKALAAPGIRIAELTPEIALDSAHFLKGYPGGDPADRMILTTAKSLGATLVTADQKMLKCAKEHHWESLSP